MLIEEATDSLKEWFDDWLESNQSYLIKWMVAEDAHEVMGLRDKIYVGHKFELQFKDKASQRIGRILEFGSQDIPKFEFITHANRFLESILPKYYDLLFFGELVDRFG